jgi:hypothetical protein
VCVCVCVCVSRPRVQNNLRKKNSETWEMKGFLKLSSKHVARESPYFIVGILIFDRPRINRLYTFLYGNTVTSDSHFILSTLSVLTSINHLAIYYWHGMHIIHTLMHIKDAFVLRKFPWLSPSCAIIVYQIPPNDSRDPTFKSWRTGDWKANVLSP